MIIDSISIKNYKSIKELDNFPLANLNILIGANGAGKSNFISFFKMLNMIIEKKFQEYVKIQGAANNILHFGTKISSLLYGSVDFGRNGYSFEIKPSEDDRLFFSKEHTLYRSYTYDDYPSERIIGEVTNETKLYDCPTVCEYVRDALKSWRVYHFHDTSSSALVKKTCDLNDNTILRPDASNLSAYLYLLKQKFEDSFFLIEETIKLIAPYFDKFILEPDMLTPDKIRLKWQEVGSDNYFDANHLSDGTLRMICLTVLLLQPNPPDTIIIDEPELGLHPYAISVLSSLMKSFAANKQLIVSTQSVTLINHFESKDIIVTDKKENASVLRRLDDNELDEWKGEYSLGQIWEKNIIGGRP